MYDDVFNEKIDKHKFAVVPINENVGYWKKNEKTGWGEWAIKVDDIILCDKVMIELEELK